MREREIKLSAGPDFQLPDLNDPGHEVSATARADEQLSTVYFDSDDHRLAGWGLSLRYRDGQGWTLKLPGEGSGALLERDEIVFHSDPATPPPAAVDLIKAYLRHAELRPQVRLSTLRRGILLHDAHGALVADVVDDTVTVLDGEHASRGFRELEVEATDCTPRGLPKAVIARLRAAGAGAPDPTPKYLRAIGGPNAAPPEIVLEKLRRSAVLADVVTHAIADGVVRLLRHDPVIRLDADPEGVHQARVATRRLRSDLRTFRAALDPEWVGALRTELGWLGGELGQARDADVLLDRLTSRSAGLSPDSREGARRVIGALARRRAQAHAQLREALDSDRYLNLLDRLIAAAQSPALVEDTGDRAAARALPAIVRRAWRPLQKKVGALGDRPADEDLHAVRILAKRCRYAAEACAPTLGEPTRKLAAAAQELQDVLGELNDAVVAERWLRDYAAHTRSGPGAFASGELAGLERQAAHRARSQWPKAWKHVTAAAPAS
jgi:CHAD domain-containing protein